MQPDERRVSLASLGWLGCQVLCSLHIPGRTYQVDFLKAHVAPRPQHVHNLRQRWLGVRAAANGCAQKEGGVDATWCRQKLRWSLPRSVLGFKGSCLSPGRATWCRTCKAAAAAHALWGTQPYPACGEARPSNKFLA